MDLYGVLDQVVALLQRRRRVTYEGLKLQFDLRDEELVVLREEILYAQPRVVDDEGRGLLWTDDASAAPAQASAVAAAPPLAMPGRALSGHTPRPHGAERRQLTVLFCDLVNSTRLASQLDAEDLREVVLAYQATAAEVLHRFDGYIAQYLGDGLLVYFGYPRAHEDDAQRAVRSALGLLDAMHTLNARLERTRHLRLSVRIGIHTGPAVVGDMGSGGRHEQLALGETPNLAGRLQSVAGPDTVAISDTTHRLVQGYFSCDDLGLHSLKGVAVPMRVHRVVGESGANDRLDAAALRGSTPLVGREPEVALLQGRWTQSSNGQGQVVLLSGEAGLGKSRLVRAITAHVVDEGAPRLTLRCSPYHINSAYHPVIDYIQRMLRWRRDDTPEARLLTMEEALRTAGQPLAEVVPLVAALLAVPLPERYPPLALSPQRQKQKTLEALVAWLVAEATERPVLAVWEDLHWVDPSSLELLELLLGRAPAAHLLLVLTCRPEFRPPWSPQPHVTTLTLTRLTRPQIEEMVLRVTAGKTWPAEVLAQIVAKTDGIPLFVEELVKAILEAGLVREVANRYVLTGPLPPIAIPATLQDALMARLDRLALGKDVAQLAAVLGREFTYEIFRSVAPLDEPALRQALERLVDAELLYQRGQPPQATYLFKHALIQDAAYQSLLKSTRQQVHQRIANVLAERFPATVASQPELVAHHYTEAGLVEDAIPYWERAGQQSIARSAYVEAINQLNSGLHCLQPLPETPERISRELTLLMALGRALMATKGYAASDVGATYTRARSLCEQGAQSPQLFPVLFGLWQFYVLQGDLPLARQLAERLHALAQRLEDPTLLLEAHRSLAFTFFSMGEMLGALAEAERGIALPRSDTHRTHAFAYGQDGLTSCLAYAALALWHLGYPEQARQRCREMLERARDLSHPFTLAHALYFASLVHQHRRDVREARECAEATIALATEQGFALYVVRGTLQMSWALAEQGQLGEGIDQMGRSLLAYRDTGSGLVLPYFLARLADASRKAGRIESGLSALGEALALVDKHGERWWEAELYRLQGELRLRQAVPDLQQAEACFRQALAIANRQQVRSLELRAAMSLSRLCANQGKGKESRRVLEEVYGWFTEGFDTADLREARGLLEATAGGAASGLADCP